MDFFITPYNTSLIYKTSMNFEDEDKQLHRQIIARRNLCDEWKLMADFILNLKPEVFRNSCQSINKGMYLELKDFSRWLKKERKENRKRKTLAALSQSPSKLHPPGYAANEMFKATKRIILGKKFVKKMKEKVLEKKQTETISSRCESNESSPTNIFSLDELITMRKDSRIVSPK